MPMLTPFLKWPGGKTWLYRQIPGIFSEIQGRYIEPFLGSGAIFFAHDQNLAILNDINSELIITFIEMRDNHKEISSLLEEHHEKHSKDYYYEIRSTVPTSNTEVAARMIYLNRACWNGLYRVNLNGKFNVPIGTKKNMLIRIEDFPKIAKRLESAEIHNTDFQKVIELATEGDFIFADPPYYSEKKGEKFHKYSSKIFSLADHERLACALHGAKNRGAKVVMTHATSNEIENLYSSIADKIIYTDRKDTLSGKSEFRGRYNELIISMG